MDRLFFEGVVFLRQNYTIRLVIAGALAGAVAGLFGAGGGMVLVPMLTASKALSEEEIFPSSLSIILPVCLVCLTVAAINGTILWKEAFPYLIGSAAGGILAGYFGKNIPVKWLHKGLGILILWGGFRYICW